jgi:cytochrome c biogenesis protein CcdA
MEVMYQISLVAAFVAGMVALFAPCCISFLLPAYLGNVFKEKKKVLLMTLVYSSGIFVVMLPVVLGAKALSNLFFEWHDQTYIFGGALMIVVGGLALLGIKLPMLNLGAGQVQKKTDVASTFMLGLVSGITSACCAPVLVGVMALSSLSPTLIQSLGVGVAYVLGMVTPLYVAAVLIERGNILDRPFLRKKLFTIKLGDRWFPVFVTNIGAAIIFVGVGVLTVVLTLMGNLGMSMGEMDIIKKINGVAFRVSEITDQVPGLDILFVLVGAYILYKLVKSANKAD